MEKEFVSFESIRYVVRYPNGYAQSRQYPVIIFLHGAGTRGNDIEVLKNNPFFLFTEKQKDFPFVIVAPQCNQNTWFDLTETLQRLVRKISGEPYVDRKRIYLMGASMGGYAVWQLAMSMPEYFAAICPICGGGMYWNAARLVNVPVWAFHGAKDTTVFVEESVKMVDAVNHSGGYAKLTIYPENGHDAWSDTYSNQKVFEWLLEYDNSSTTVLADVCTGSQAYG